MASRRINDIKYLYTRDDGLDQLHAQRQYIDTISNVLLTPITALFAARVIPTDTKVERPKNTKNRHVVNYIENPNVSTGVSEIELAIPYASGDLRHTAHLREIIAMPNVLCVDYIGETKSNI